MEIQAAGNRRILRMDRVWKFFYSAFARPFIRRKLRKVNNFSYAGLDIVVYPGVFHPGYFFSTLFFMDFIHETDMRGKTFCEAGTGSGIISLLAYRNGAEVFSFDVNKKAVENVLENFNLNFNPRHPSLFHIFNSDLFDHVPPLRQDYVFINPPYFFKDAHSSEQRAWYCGKDGQYFKKLFYQLPEYTDESSCVYMVLAENADTIRIKSIAARFGYSFELVHSSKIKWEWNFLFRLVKN